MATPEILEHCLATSVDILLIQEPQVIQQRVISSIGRCFYKAEGDRPVRAAMVLFVIGISGLMRAELSDPDCVCVKVGKRGEKSINFVLIYCSLTKDIMVSLIDIERIILIEGRKGVVCGGDLISRSGLWFSREVDMRGEAIEELIAAHNLKVLNQVCELATFEDTRGRTSNIDATMVTRDVVCRDCKISDDDFSDHRRINFECTIGAEHDLAETGNGQVSFDLKRANWKELMKAVRTLVSQTMWNELQPGNDKAAMIQSIILEACKS